MIKAVRLGRGSPSSQKGWSILKDQRTDRTGHKPCSREKDFRRPSWFHAMAWRHRGSPCYPGTGGSHHSMYYFVKSEVERALQITTTEVLKPCSFFPPLSSVSSAGICIWSASMSVYWPSSQASLKSGKFFWWFYVHAEHEQQAGRNLWNHTGTLGRQNEKNSLMLQFLSWIFFSVGLFPPC